MDRDRLAARLMATFLGELDEHAIALNRDLLGLEGSAVGDEVAATVRDLFRTVHSLKGAARAACAGPIEAACHEMEEILAVARRDGSRPPPETIALMLTAADAIVEAGGRLRDGRDLSGGPLAGLVPLLKDATKGEPAPAGAAPSEPIKPAEDASAPMAPEPSTRGGLASVRVPAEKLDSLMTASGELLTARGAAEGRLGELVALRDAMGRWEAEWRRVESEVSGVRPGRRGLAIEPGRRPLSRQAARSLGMAGDRIRQTREDLDRLVAAIAADGRVLARAADQLDHDIRRVRMLPFAQACLGLERAVRDVARDQQKPTKLVIEGGDVELDRSILEGLKDPLLHLVRNAVGHGIEPPEGRLAAGKPPTARVVVSAELRGDRVEVAVSDDGRGLDLEGLRQQARRRGVAAPADDADAAWLAFQPGLSTAAAVTTVSGRGVGLDVVKARVEALHGAIEISTAPGGGTRFTMSLPLTLTTLRAVLVEAGGQLYALPGAHVRRLVLVAPEDVRRAGGREVYLDGGPPWPLASLAATLGRPSAPAAGATASRRPTLLVVAGDRRVAFTVDALLAEQEVVIKGLGPRIRRARLVAGATILPNGRVAPVLNVAELVRTALEPGAPRDLPAASATTEACRARLLVVDDSLTTRTLEQAILESAGYEVRAAADGEAGWEALREHGADLVVSDVDMPRMDGFALTEAIRASSRFRDLPVILVTGRDTDEDRARGAEVGADDYLIKSDFDQRDLLAAIGRLL